jgi:hypothetical protein
VLEKHFACVDDNVCDLCGHGVEVIRLSAPGAWNGPGKRPGGRFSRFRPRTGDLERGPNHPVRSRGLHPWRVWRANGTSHVGRCAQPPGVSRRGREGERRREPRGRSRGAPRREGEELTPAREAATAA